MKSNFISRHKIAFPAIVTLLMTASSFTLARPSSQNIKPARPSIGVCLPYGSTVTLVGRVTLRMVYGSPGFGKDPLHDQKSYVPIVTLDNPICANGGGNPDFDPPETNVIQLELLTPDFPKIYFG